jgi:hypothetical protein
MLETDAGRARAQETETNKSLRTRRDNLEQLLRTRLVLVERARIKSEIRDIEMRLSYDYLLQRGPFFEDDDGLDDSIFGGMG